MFFSKYEFLEVPYNKRGYVICILAGLLALSFFVVREVLERRKIRTTKDLTVKKFLEHGVLSKSDTLVVSTATGTKVLVLENCIFREFDSNFGIVKNDSSGLTYLTKRIVPDADCESSIDQWKKQITKTEPSYRFSNIKRDSLDNVLIETADVDLLSNDSKEMKGQIKIVRIGGLYYLFQIVSYNNMWSKLASDVKKVNEPNWSESPKKEIPGAGVVG